MLHMRPEAYLTPCICSIADATVPHRVGNGEKSRVGNDAWKKRYTLMEEMPPLPPFPPFRGY